MITLMSLTYIKDILQWLNCYTISVIHQHHIHGNLFPVFSPCLSSSPWVGSALFSLCSEGKLEGGWKHATVKKICPCFHGNSHLPQPWRNALNAMLQQKRCGGVCDIPMCKSWYRLQNTICNHKTGKLHWWVLTCYKFLLAFISLDIHTCMSLH